MSPPEAPAKPNLVSTRTDTRVTRRSRPSWPPGRALGAAPVLWGDPKAPHLLLAEGIETAAALAHAHRAEIESGELVIAAGLSTSSIRTFVPWPANRQVTVAADRDERQAADRSRLQGRREGGARLRPLTHEHLEVRLALPGDPGAGVDWLDVLRGAGAEMVRAGIAGATSGSSLWAERAGRDLRRSWRTGQGRYRSRAARDRRPASADPSAPFEPEALAKIAAVKNSDPPRYQRILSQLKQAGVRMRDFERELRRASFRVIEGGPATAATDPAVAAGHLRDPTA